MTIRLIVNADDFGENSAVNWAILEAHRHGLVTSTSLMVTGEAWEEAVEMARSTPSLRVGLHVVLVHGRPVSPPETIPELVTPEGRFPQDAARAGLRWFVSRRAREQIRREVLAQVERFLRTGLPLDHLNGHLHFHVHPAVMAVLMEVAEDLRVPRLRLPWEPWRLSLTLDRSGLGRKLGYVLAFGLLARIYRPQLRRRGIFFPDAVFGLLQTGRIHKVYVVELLRRLPPGTYEFYAHPRLDTLQGRRELEALTAAEALEIVRVRGIQRTTYSELYPASP